MANGLTTDIPVYVDTQTPAVRWYIFHLIVLVASLIMAYLAASFLEFEISKWTHPGVYFIDSPRWFDLIAAGSVLALAIANLSILPFVLLRHLWIRRWMLGTTLLGWMILAVMALVLRQSFIQIILPTTKSL